MKILYVAPNIRVPGTNGGSTHVTEVTRALRKNNQVMVLARRGSRGEQIVGLGSGTPPGILRHLLPLIQYPTALKHAKKFQPDVIYERFSAFGLGILIGRALKVPVVSMVLDQTATQKTLNGAQHLVTTAPHLIPPRYHHKVTQVSWGANTDLFTPDMDGTPVRAELNIKPGEVLIGYTGAFYHWHGLDTMVEAARLLKEQKAELPKFRFMLVGDGEKRRTIEGAVKSAQVQDLFVFTGRVPYTHVPTYLAACDICAAPYNPDRHKDLAKAGMFFDPLKVFEYMAAGKATVVFDSPNMRNLFEENEHTLFVPPGDAQTLAQTIRRLITDPELRNKLGKNSRQKTLNQYSWQAHGNHLEEIFTKAIKEYTDQT